MPSNGPQPPANGSSVAPGIAWTNPGNITAEDGSVATCAIMSMMASEELRGKRYDFAAIPGGATIDGIVVEIKKSGTSLAISDFKVQLLKAGTGTGDNKAAGGSWPTSLTYSTYGGSSDLWGTTWTVSDVNDINFGVLLVANSTPGGTANVDHMRITVYYTDASTGGKCSVTVVRQPYHPAMFEE